MPALLVAFANHSARLALAHGPRKISTRRFNYTEMSSKCFSQVKKKKEIIKAEQFVPDTWLWEYRIRRTPLRSPSFSKLVVGARGGKVVGFKFDPGPDLGRVEASIDSTGTTPPPLLARRCSTVEIP